MKIILSNLTKSHKHRNLKIIKRPISPYQNQNITDYNIKIMKSEDYKKEIRTVISTDLIKYFC